jgi:hypothetical protein
MAWSQSQAIAGKNDLFCMLGIKLSALLNFGKIGDCLLSFARQWDDRMCRHLADGNEN